MESESQTKANSTIKNTLKAMGIHRRGLNAQNEINDFMIRQGREEFGKVGKFGEVHRAGGGGGG